MPTKNKIDCPAFHKRFGGYPYSDRVPRTVRMLVTVTSDRIPGVEPAHTPEARQGQTYPAWTNSHGAVVAVMDNGARLGLRPAEFEVDSWHHLAAEPATQHPEPIAWMVGTAFWWTKEEAERDAAATGLPIIAVGPIADSFKPADRSEQSLDMVLGHHQGEPVARVEVGADRNACVTITDSDWLRSLKDKTSHQVVPLYPHADPGEVERLRTELTRMHESNWKSSQFGIKLQAKLANQDALLHKLKETIQREYWDEYAGLDETRELIDAALSSGQEPRTPAAPYQNRLCHIDYTAHPYRCGCLKGDEEAQRRYDEHFRGASAKPGATIERNDLIPMVDAAMVETSNILPPLKRSDCEKLIRAALERQP
ncbi:hypothetical protein [Pseudomonas sp. LLC-1]|uniref:hypothetical protein n=1 Tax=Pseudomonas sp. LLC-1 TaxID=1812180 RepID=UPI002114AAF1|nr:hypothetical protein [Pseudomonas sp. LLC-1]